MIDAHQHFWQFNEREYGWITPEMGVLRADFGPTELREECTAAGVSGVVSIQARSIASETADLLRHAARHDFIVGVVGWVDLCADDVGSQLDRCGAHPKFVGVREICQGAPDAEFFDNAAFNRGVAELDRRELTYDLLILADQIPAATQFVDRHPEQRFVVDHCAKPPVRRKSFPREWAANLHNLARRENVYCKLSGLTTEVRDTHSSWDLQLLRPYVEVALDAFGADRVMFGSDWPVSLLSTSYLGWVHSCETIVKALSSAERLSIFDETARCFYRI